MTSRHHAAPLTRSIMFGQTKMISATIQMRQLAHVDGCGWKSLPTSYPPSDVEVHERRQSQEC
jgi:transposase